MACQHNRSGEGGGGSVVGSRLGKGFWADPKSLLVMLGSAQVHQGFTWCGVSAVCHTGWSWQAANGSSGGEEGISVQAAGADGFQVGIGVTGMAWQ